mmetsp:Transcript_27156/g.80887  ORF Transcript_27156/g.80887 Transcript_27156/m.80887 type:complete len:209 (+) Transcript_27156:98-724(+)
MASRARWRSRSASTAWRPSCRLPSPPACRRRSRRRPPTRWTRTGSRPSGTLASPSAPGPWARPPATPSTSCAGRWSSWARAPRTSASLRGPARRRRGASSSATTTTATIPAATCSWRTPSPRRAGWPCCRTAPWPRTTGRSGSSPSATSWSTSSSPGWRTGRWWACSASASALVRTSARSSRRPSSSTCRSTWDRLALRTCSSAAESS